jgi:hypothetical protein
MKTKENSNQQLLQIILENSSKFDDYPPLTQQNIDFDHLLVLIAHVTQRLDPGADRHRIVCRMKQTVSKQPH